MCAEVAEGPDEGSLIPNVTFLDCDGNEHNLQDLCGYSAGWVFEYAAWCPPCQRFAPSVNAIYERHREAGLGAFFIISETENFEAPDAEYCAATRRALGLTMPVLYDRDGAFQRALRVNANDVNVVTGRGGLIQWKAQYSSDDAESRIREALRN
jgi:thiol-disulfide isomerase/thioredoxin